MPFARDYARLAVEGHGVTGCRGGPARARWLRTVGIKNVYCDQSGNTAAVIAANREMQRTGNLRSPEELARVTATYRRVTDADNQRGIAHC
ncbi:MAG: hypothetical protein DLM60_05770 [Pseudonocardiales bacterium]|nr:MAG: hypothetical protein DLM60_05770 [Pseudonocardiales bacterium]